MNFISLFSGIGGFDRGLEIAGHTCVAQVEIDKNCQRVLRRHWPHVPLFDDVRDFRKGVLDGTVDLVVGGFPCTDVSVAGKRGGLAGSESGLWFEFHRVLAEFRPQWLLIENVPGLLSSNGGLDMGTILGGLADLGYGWAYRVLDSRFFGVPQRRRRVFIVGCAGGAIARAASVLFESEGVRGDTAPRGKTEEEVAGTLDARTRGGGFPGSDGAASGHVIAVEAFDWQVAGSERTTITRKGDYAQVRANAHDAVHIPHVAKALRASDGGIEREDMHTLIPMAFETRYARNGRGAPEEIVPPLKAQSGKSGKGDSAPVIFQQNQRDEVREMPIAGALANQPGAHQQNYLSHGGIRRLTPVETLRLQGFDDNWCDGLSDTAIYRATGNAVTVNVIEWLGRRLKAAEECS